MTAKTKAGLLIALIFVAGLAGGVALDRLALWRIFPGPLAQGQLLRPEPFLLRLGRDLNLTQEQRRELEGIVEESRRRMMELRGQMGPQLETIRERAHERLETILTPEQRARWIEFRRRHWERMRRMRPFMHGMRGRGPMGPRRGRGMGMGRGGAQHERRR